jgi:hypothetical protein
MTETKTSTSPSETDIGVESPEVLAIASPEDEADFVSRANRGVEHPDNMVGDLDDEVVVVPAAPPVDEDMTLPSDDELDALIADVDVDDVDEVGFDDSDFTEESEGAVPLDDIDLLGGES